MSTSVNTRVNTGGSIKKVAVVDLSYMMYKNRFAMSLLSVPVETDNGVDMVPTGHIYGCITDIKQLSFLNDIVILAVDSVAPERRELLPEYKAGRHKETGNSFDDYNIQKDTDTILSLVCSMYSNVCFVREDGLEADDLIGSLIKHFGSKTERFFLSVYHNDADILQTKGSYIWYRSLSDIEDIGTYISNKFKLVERTYDYLPVWYKVIRGDSSDKIPPAIRRLPSKLVEAIIMKTYDELEGDDFSKRSFDVFISCVDSVLSEHTSWWVKSGCPLSKNTGCDTYKDLKRNYEVVKPIYKEFNVDFRIKKDQYVVDSSKVNEILSRYRIVHI